MAAGLRTRGRNTTYLVQVAIRKETGTTGNSGPTTLPATLGRFFERRYLDRVLLEGTDTLLGHLLGIGLRFGHFDRMGITRRNLTVFNHAVRLSLLEGRRDCRTGMTPARVTVSRDHNNKSRFDQLEVSLRTEKENEK